MAETRFTIQFSQTDPSHLHVAEILNRQGRRSKAQYIVNAVLHYENCGETPNIQRSVAFDEKFIEAVVNRILRDRAEAGTGDPPNSASVSQGGTTKRTFAEEMSFDDAVEALGQDGFDAIVGALDLFRKK
jgi:hypothetical protein